MAEREIVLDTETTGLSPELGDRVVEIGCVELVNHVPTGRHFHRYINPERDMPADAFRVHGLSAEFLSGHKVFAEHIDEMLAFLGDARLIIHNADFDLGFLNHELSRASRPKLSNKVTDTVALARKKHPGARVSLDALCKHYGIDTSKRSLHGALLDAQILAEVYLELIGGRQVRLELASTTTEIFVQLGSEVRVAAARPTPLSPRIGEADIAAHEEFIARLGKHAIWRKYQN